VRPGGGSLAIASALVASALAPPSAHANGAFPASGQVIVDPSDAGVVFVSATFGLAKSTDAGASFYLVCEEAIGFSSGLHPFYAMTQTGAILGGLPDGLVWSRGETCAFTRAPELKSLFVVDVSVDPSGRAIAVALPPAPADAVVFVSTDDLVS